MAQRQVYLKTTESCNLNCAHCFTSGSAPSRALWDVPAVIDWMQRYFAYIPVTDSVHIDLHGGEPFLAPIDELKEVTRVIKATHHPRLTIGAVSNLTFKLSSEHVRFIVDELDSFATSWDPDIRFANDRQQHLWRNNLRRVIAAGKDVVLNVSLSRGVTQMPTDDLIHFLRSTGCYRVLFDRITFNGNARQHAHLFPTNAEINDWYVRMHQSTERLGARDWFINAALEDVYAKFESGNTSCGTFCRDCEEKIFTVNANGTIGGCANSAAEESFGHISQSLLELHTSPQRFDTMLQERLRNDQCFSCAVFAYCGSDCHRLAWEGDVCASPKALMHQLAKLPYQATPTRRVIPIRTHG